METIVASAGFVEVGRPEATTDLIPVTFAMDKASVIGACLKAAVVFDLVITVASFAPAGRRCVSDGILKLSRRGADSRCHRILVTSAQVEADVHGHIGPTLCLNIPENQTVGCS